jgi:hypothetical protein
MTDKTNIVSINELKKRSEAQKQQSNYSLYLKSLSHAQLETEINYLLKSISNKSLAEESYDKGKLIIKEISNRVDPATKLKIQKLTKN